MKRLSSPSLFALVCFVVLTAPAYAGTANFGANCSWDANYTHINCIFDALRGDSLGNPGSSCASGTPQYFWDFGDFNSSPNWSYNNLTSHQYTLPIPSGSQGYPYGYYINVFVQCPEGLVQGTRYMCVYGFGFPGCINLGSGSSGWQ